MFHTLGVALCWRLSLCSLSESWLLAWV